MKTAQMNDYDRPGTGAHRSRYGEIQSLDATTEEFTLRKDRSFTFAIDALDEDETQQQLAAASALARQQRYVVIPEVDTYTYGVMCEDAGFKPAAITLTKENICTEIMKANNKLDNAEVPESNRQLVVTPDTYLLLKQCKDIVMETDIGNDLRLKGVVATVDGANVIKVPAPRLPADFGFMLCHPTATVAPTKLESYKIHHNPPFINGDLVEGRIAYDAFVPSTRNQAIYYQALTNA
ncbi:MAG: hypothetical protein Q4C52_04805 [Eubacteriales bacterium]|nr:hypothetical protein [Eubacteriales bacterium]